MNLKKTLSASALALIFTSLSTNAYALGTFSRACNFYDLPEGSKDFLGRFFYALGGADISLRLASSPAEVQKRYWILEAITTDYLESRYYLYAHAGVYGYVLQPGNRWGYSFFQHYTSGWTAEQISLVMKADPAFAPFFLNRQFAYSARAGDPNIVVDMNNYFTKYKVKGRHFYYDPKDKSTNDIGGSEATDCNVTDLGLENWINR